MADAALFRGLLKEKQVVRDGKVLARRDDIYVIWFDLHSLPGLLNLHGSVPFQKFDHHALVLRGEMGDKDKGHAAVGGHVTEELLEGLETSGRRSDPDHVEIDQTRSQGTVPFWRRRHSSSCRTLQAFRL
jgi:hypothetical protein